MRPIAFLGFSPYLYNRLVRGSIFPSIFGTPNVRRLTRS